MPRGREHLARGALYTNERTAFYPRLPLRPQARNFLRPREWGAGGNRSDVIPGGALDQESRFFWKSNEIEFMQ
jgi:hypothetical protein